MRILFDNVNFTSNSGPNNFASKLANELLPLVKDNGWFFDSELIVLAIKNHYNVKEIPVRWVDDPDTRVKIIKTAIEDLSGIARLKFGYVREVE